MAATGEHAGGRVTAPQNRPRMAASVPPRAALAAIAAMREARPRRDGTRHNDGRHDDGRRTRADGPRAGDAAARGAILNPPWCLRRRA
ncbi:hypothetical protein [Lysobacter enzymogenes]|uniref:hypothetical protein n=1 Tax=Lysobacter enzymogenes TaxID=69 RepID=UPI001AFB0E0F|nr:hypothetical protein [Lysobacter enzymogenes]QQQ00508.1 hypothetical protein JHW41_20860 [Lysobacter enzymogenes]